MPYKGWRAINIREEIYAELYKIYEGERTSKLINFPTWLNEYLFEIIEENKLLREYAPGLSYIGAEGNTVYIKDYFIDRIVEVEIHDQGTGSRFLYCRYCQRDDCLHVGFCFAIREVNKILVEREFKKPRVSKQ